MNDLTPFTYGAHEVRTITRDGEPWFVLADLCKVLDLSAPHMVAKRIADDMKGRSSISTLGGVQRVTIVSEAGMYAVIMRSDKPESEPFRRWVTSEVLPTIRKTGGYGTVKELTFEEKTLEVMKELSARVETQRAELETARPKVDAYDAFMDADGCYSIGAVGKMLGMGQNRLFDELYAHGVLISKGPMRKTPYQKYAHHFRVNAYSYDRSDGNTSTSYTTKVRPSGVEFIRRKLGLAPVLMEMTA